MATNMSSNKLVWVIVGVLAVGVVAAVINSSNEPDPVNQRVVTPKPVTPNVKAEDGDTVSETIKEVTARYTAQVDENKALKEKQTDLEKRLALLENNKTTVGSSVAIADDPLVQQLTNELGSMKQDFKLLTDNITKTASEKTAALNGYEVSEADLGWVSTGTSKRSGAAVGGGNPAALPGYVTIRPMTRTQQSLLDPKELRAGLQSAMPAKPTDSKPGVTNTLKQTGGKLTADITPHYTIPARSTIFEAVAMTALIGTVPLGGKVNDPFPAKIIVGDENLATNGLRIPGLKGIVFEGLARGNWNLSCVAVTLTAATYTFTDGRVQHMRYDQQNGGGGSQSKSAQSNSPFAEGEASASIGYVTNRQGVPCIPGKRVTDAHKQLFTMGLLGAAKAHFDAKAAAETTTTSNPLGGASSEVTGNKAAFINNSTYSDSMNTVMDFYSKRMRDTFDVIYVDPAAKVSLNITQDLLIDYHSDARKLVYATGGRNGKAFD